MKKLISTVLVVCLVCLFALPAAAAGDVGYTTPQSVKMNKSGKASFTIVVSGGEQNYAGAQIEAVAGSGVTIDSVSFNKKGSTMAPQIARGSTYFSLFSDDNVFSGDVTCTVNISYSGTAASQVLIKDLQRYHVLAPGEVNATAANSQKTISVEPYSAGNGNNNPGGNNPGGNTNNPGGSTAGNPQDAPGGTTDGGTGGTATAGGRVAAVAGAAGRFGGAAGAGADDALEADEDTAAPATPATPRATADEDTDDPTAQVDGGQTPAAQPNTPAEQNSGSLWFIWVIIAAAVAAGVIIAVVVVRRKKKQEQ